MVQGQMELYKRLEPNDPERDELPLLPTKEAAFRIRAEGDLSDRIWKCLFKDASADAVAQLDAIAKEALKHEAEHPRDEATGKFRTIKSDLTDLHFAAALRE